MTGCERQHAGLLKFGLRDHFSSVAFFYFDEPLVLLLL